MVWGFFVNSELHKITHKKDKVQARMREARLKELLADTEKVKRYASPTATR